MGVFVLIDDGLLDYKILAIEDNEAKEKKVFNLQTYKNQHPGAIEEVILWYRDYKSWQGGKRNTFTWGG